MRGALVNESTCTVDGCGRHRPYRLYCHAHYRRWKRTGDPGPAEVRSAEPENPICSFANCQRPRRTAGLCAAHYLQKHHGRPLTPILRRPDTTARDSQGRKQCTACNEWLPTTRFYGNAKTKDGLATACLRCRQDSNLQRGYGITADQYDTMFRQQGGVCAICNGVNRDGRKLFVDHDHGTGAVRGLLCNLCNRGIGNLRDSVTLLEAAVSYLKGHGAWSGKQGRSI